MDEIVATTALLLPKDAPRSNLKFPGGASPQTPLLLRACLLIYASSHPFLCALVCMYRHPFKNSWLRAWFDTVINYDTSCLTLATPRLLPNYLLFAECSGGFRGGKGGAFAPPFGGEYNVFCLNNLTSQSNDYAGVACSNNNQA